MDDTETDHWQVKDMFYMIELLYSFHMGEHQTEHAHGDVLHANTAHLQQHIQGNPQVRKAI